MAAEAGYWKIVTMLLEEGVRPGALADGTTPLMLAACYGFVECVRILMALDAPGADETLRTAHERKDGMTALHMAALGGHVEVIKVLSDAKHPVGATARSNYGETLWNTSALLAENFSRAAAAGPGVEKGSRLGTRQTSLLQHHEHSTTGRLFQEISGVTPLHIACDHGHVHAAEELLRRGMEVDAVDSRGVTGARRRGDVAEMRCRGEVAEM